jgi:hypothetical protein
LESIKKERSVGLIVIRIMMLVYSIICFSYDLFIGQACASYYVLINSYYVFLGFININGLICFILSLKVLQLNNRARIFAIFYSFLMIISLAVSSILVFGSGILSWHYSYEYSLLAKHILLQIPIFIVFLVYFSRSNVEEQFSPPKDKWQIINESMSKTSSEK